jgi:hypothetical protein
VTGRMIERLQTTDMHQYGFSTNIGRTYKPFSLLASEAYTVIADAPLYEESTEATAALSLEVALALTKIRVSQAFEPTGKTDLPTTATQAFSSDISLATSVTPPGKPDAGNSFHVIFDEP